MAFQEGFFAANLGKAKTVASATSRVIADPSTTLVVLFIEYSSHIPQKVH